MSALSIELCGEEIHLLSQKAAYWPARKTLLVADVHFGKAEAFRAAGVPIPAGTTSGAIARLDPLPGSVQASRLVLLGDLWHAKKGRTREAVDEVASWRARHPELEIVLVEGNHDRRSGALPAELHIESVPHLDDGPFSFRHHPQVVDGAYVLCGHIHPCVYLRGRAKQSAKLPCFWFAASVGTLPAFGEFTGCAEVAPVSGDRVFVVCGDEVIAR